MADADGAAGAPTPPHGFAVAGFAPRPGGSSAKRRGKVLRQNATREQHAEFAPAADRPGAVEAIEASNAGRLEHLVPIRLGRMSATPFAFLRGSAGLMAADLAHTPTSGITAQLCGDAHAANFGLYGDARGRLVMDINDFDETVPGPWEWDLKRLATSLVLAAREVGADEQVARQAAFESAGSYRRTMRALAKLPALDAWNAVADEHLVAVTDAHELTEVLNKVSAKALGNTSARFAAKSTVREAEGRWRFTAAPPVLSQVPYELAASVAASLAPYADTVPAELRPLLSRHHVQDVAFRVVGTGSVGTRSYVVLLTDHRDKPLVLQVKEARPSVLLPHLARAGYPVREVPAHEGQRVVLGQKRMQVVSDTLLGWTTVDGLPYQVRQFRNRKGSVDPAALLPAQLDDYARITGALLARAHAHTAEPELISGYCGKSEALDEAVAAFAVAYADRTEADHADLVAAIRSGRLAAESGV
ncbi:uncharacterized protein (DUF2252 family) [Kitasatospora herbaricolor]|uniref:DUF2252 domain-containing protein n=1 Tax=Kitasatospora herbaricolor TaxID=68217 RepID=UPI002792DB41|nr:uncharacterized protein (DUF2252 family) [Kitasatospora herbaricolor]